MTPTEPGIPTSAEARKTEGIDVVAVIVAACLLVFSLVRGVIPALIDGEHTMALVVAAMGLLALAAAFLPAPARSRQP